ncbi:hypothetical protein EFV60_03240 [Yersinia enterocolitica]|nr:hypothetical protein [Yersinia enterocolitica]
MNLTDQQFESLEINPWHHRLGLIVFPMAFTLLLNILFVTQQSRVQGEECCFSGKYAVLV